jgi:hypothetical protein
VVIIILLFELAGGDALEDRAGVAVGADAAVGAGAFDGGICFAATRSLVSMQAMKIAQVDKEST